MKIKKQWVSIIGVVCAVILMSSQVYAGEKIGTLKIKVIPGSGHNLIIRSSADVDAVFTDASGKTEHYIGEMGIGLGIDLSIKKSEELSYVVLSPLADYKIGSYALQGKYFGDYASATVSKGVSAKELIGVGGLEEGVILQPVSMGTNTGVGAAGGLGYLFLQKDPKK